MVRKFRMGIRDYWRKWRGVAMDRDGPGAWAVTISSVVNERFALRLRLHIRKLLRDRAKGWWHFAAGVKWCREGCCNDFREFARNWDENERLRVLI